MAVIKIKVNGLWTEIPALVGPSGTAVIAPDYNDLTFPVKKGTACLHEGLFYVADQNISAEEDWTSAHWRLTTIGEEIQASEEKVYFVNGTHASLTSAWTGDLSEVETLQNGLMILYRLPIGVGSGSVSLTLTLKNESSGAVPVYYNDGTRVTGYNSGKGLKAGSVLLLTYYNSTWKCTSVNWDKYNTHLGMVVTSGGYNLDVNGFVLNATTDDNFIPTVSGYTMLRVHNETSSGIDTFDDGDLMIGIGDRKFRLYVDGAYQFTDSAPITIPNGSYLCFYDVNGVSSGVGAFYINTDGSIPGQVPTVTELSNEISEIEAQIAVATIAETQAIIDEWEEEIAMIYETQLVDEGTYDMRFATEDDAEDIAAAFVSGKSVMIHIPGIITYIVPEIYIRMTGYAYPYQSGGGAGSLSEQFVFGIPNSTNITQNIYVDANGKLCFPVYVD